MAKIDILIKNIIEKKVLDLGFVKICDCMPRLVEEDQTCDNAICQAARVSYGNGTKTVNEDRGLIRYLMRHSHSTPFEMVQFKFHVKLPLFVFAQWVRHRSGSFNSLSARYSVMKDEFYIPSDMRIQSNKNKQGSEEKFTENYSEESKKIIEEHCLESYKLYEKFLNEAVSREQSRMILPQNLYTEFYWSVNLHNLLHFMSLRSDAHAQQEMQEYSNAILDLITPLVPNVIKAWEDYHPMRGAMLLTRKEVEKLNKDILNAKIFMGNHGCGFSDNLLNSGNKREDEEWLTKSKLLGI